MFTGLVEGVGNVVRLASKGGGKEITIRVPSSLESLNPGDSLSLSGACLTVVKANKEEVVLEAIPETLSRTTLAGLKIGSKLNLERAILAGSRLGGHFVQGHVDGVGVIQAIRRKGESSEIEVQAGLEIMKYLVEKGSVALDGVSLTLVSISPDSFKVALIPHSQKHTTLGNWQVGDEVNIEVDLLSKYVERFLKPEKKSTITPEWLAEQGFK
jgi:riboflavin synthase